MQNTKFLPGLQAPQAGALTNEERRGVVAELKVRMILQRPMIRLNLADYIRTNARRLGDGGPRGNRTGDIVGDVVRPAQADGLAYDDEIIARAVRAICAYAFSMRPNPLGSPSSRSVTPSNFTIQ